MSRSTIVWLALVIGLANLFGVVVNGNVENKIVALKPAVMVYAD